MQKIPKFCLLGIDMVESSPGPISLKFYLPLKFGDQTAPGATSNDILITWGSNIGLGIREKDN